MSIDIINQLGVGGLSIGDRIAIKATEKKVTPEEIMKIVLSAGLGVLDITDRGGEVIGILEKAGEEKKFVKFTPYKEIVNGSKNHH